MKTAGKVAALLVFALLSIFVLCTIKDDNGSLAPTGPNTTPITPITPTTIKPVLVITPDSQYVGVGDTLSISITALQDSSLARPYANAKVLCESSTGWQSAETLTTDSRGRATLKVKDTVKAKIEIIFHCNGTTQTIFINVTDTPDKIQKMISIMPGRSVLKADGKDSTIIQVMLKNENNNPIVGQCVQFITSAGMIMGIKGSCSGTGQSSTDDRGIAQAILTSANVNDTAYITAYLISDQTKIAQTRVVFKGVTILLHADSTNLKPGQSAIISAYLVNGSNDPVAFSPIYFNLGKGTSSNLAITSKDTLTGPEGNAQCVIRGNTTGTDSLVVTAAGATSTLKINVTDLLLTINLDDQVLQARDTKSTLLHVLFTSSTGSPLANKDVKIKRSYQKDDGKDTSDFILSKTDAQGKCAITINALPYECTMGLEVTAFNSTTELASAATSISFITTRTMVINALPTVIQADGTSKSTITVQVKNESNNPMVGDDISFTTDAGLVTAKSKTDENGRAVADLQSDRRNTIATVKATLVKDPTKFVTVMVEFSGVELTASANPPSINSSGKDSTTILITLIDAAKNPIPGEPINFSKLQDSTHIYRLDTATNNRGEARCKVYGTGTGTDTIKIEAAGATTKVAFSYSSNYLKIAVDTIPIQPCFANGKDSTKIDITYNLGDQRTPVQNATLDVSVTLGSMNQDTVFTKRLTMTPANGGEISFFMKNPTFANTASIFVYAKSTSEVTSASYQLYFKAARIYHIDLSGTPEVIATNGGKAKIIAVAYDSMGNRVKDERIAFNMVSGPGGGEYIDPPTAITAEDGSAVTYLVSGKIPSLFRQVWINAGDLSAIKSDTVKFTITGPPHAITIRQNINTGHDFNDGTFGLPCAAIVTDVNGNPVADGTEVTFSSKITGWVTHRPIANFNSATTTNWCYNITIDTVLVIWPFEDLNDNYKCDPGEDINGDSVASRGEDIDGDGKFTLGPPYLDINGNGQRDYSPSQPGHYDPPEPYQMCYGYDSLGKYVARRVFADYNGNGILDTVEPLFINMTDSDYTAQLLAYKALHHNKGYDFDNNHNGIPDPQTTVSITRTVQTVGGKATNEIIYGQADATKIQVMIWAESQGIKTESPAQFVLPIIK